MIIKNKSLFFDLDEIHKEDIIHDVAVILDRTDLIPLDKDQWDDLNMLLLEIIVSGDKPYNLSDDDIFKIKHIMSKNYIFKLIFKSNWFFD